LPLLTALPLAFCVFLEVMVLLSEASLSGGGGGHTS
jgi:hypothetical protein